jgi:hypothetical protein
MGELAPLEIVYAFARILAIGVGILCGFALVLLLYLCLSEVRQKRI